MAANTHIIRKQVLELKINSSEGAFHLQQQAGNYYHHQLLPALEKIFDELCRPEETIQLDKLEINLGIMKIKNMDAAVWNDEIYRFLKMQITEQLKNSDQKKIITTVATKENASRQWLFYMQHGYLNWNTIAPGEKWYGEILESLATDFVLVAALRKLIRENNNALQRIVNSHTISFLVNLVRIMTTKKLEQLELLIEEITSVLFYWFKEIKKGEKSIKAISLSVWKNIILLSAGASIKNYTDETFIKIIVKENVSLAVYAVATAQLKDKLIVTGQIIKEMADEHLQNKKNVKQDINLADEQLIDEINFDKTNNLQTIDGEGIFVQYAGMVLLHPFLSTFFKRLNLTESGNFKNSACWQKAMLLLHYLATGSATAQEYELVMPKVICAWPLQQAVSFTGTTTAEELEEADNLLQSVIAKWDKLKNSSAAALQENFLQRNGKIFTKNETLFVQVETGSLDMLLDFLPWSISIIKLPWMLEMIRVEWR